MNAMKDQEETVVTFRPGGKKGTTMLKSHYDQMASYILSLLDNDENVTLNSLVEKAQADISDSIDSDVAWYILQVKLDLEARDLIRVVPAPYNKLLFFLRITRQGQKKIRLEKQLDEWKEE
jgi:hypothetical protein